MRERDAARTIPADTARDDGTPGMGIVSWLIRLLSGRPHFYIGGTERPYLLRWHLLPRNRWMNLYLHKFCRDDDDRALHDHPWWFVSLMLAGVYREYTPGRGAEGQRGKAAEGDWVCEMRRGGSIAFRRAEHRHRVELLKRDDGTPIPCWTLVLTGSNVRTWGFWCSKGFVPWHDFVNMNDPGDIGPGCGA
jgi:hypothetical protein